MDIQEFHESVVSPFVRDFEANRGSVRYAYGAVWALDSFASHIFYRCRDRFPDSFKSDSSFKRYFLSPRSSDFRLICDVSAVVKHAKSHKPPHETLVLCSTHVFRMHLDGAAAYFAGPDGDDWGDQVIVHNDRNLFSPLLPKALRAEQFLLQAIADPLGLPLASD